MLMCERKLTGDLIGIPLEVLTEPRDGQALVARWWAVARGDLALFYRHRGMRGWSPQCNTHLAVATRVVSDLYDDSKAIFVGSAFVGNWDEDRGYILTKHLVQLSVPLNGIIKCHDAKSES